EAVGAAGGRRLGDGVDADIAACPGAVLDDDLLAEPLPELLRDDPRHDIGAGARGERHHQTDRPLEPGAVAGLGGGGARQCQQGQRDRPQAHHLAPITASGNQVAISGKTHSISTARTMRATKGMTPQTTSRKGISGAMFLITNRLRPTGGWINPISITMVMITPNQTRSKPAALSGGRMIG